MQLSTAVKMFVFITHPVYDISLCVNHKFSYQDQMKGKFALIVALILSI